MTAPDRPAVMKKAQRYRLDFQTLEAHNSTRILPQSDGQLVFYGDHVAALAACASQSKRVAVEAKIEALEELNPDWVEALGEDIVYYEYITAKIAALRKELER